MPLHKSSRAPRLDPTMISAPLGDFRHTMHIGRGGDTFGDTSFLSTLGPSSAPPDPEGTGCVSSSGPETAVNHGGYYSAAPQSPEGAEPRQTESVSSLNLDLDLDLGPSMLGDVLGVMDALGQDADIEDVFAPKADTPLVEKGRGQDERAVTQQKELNGKKSDSFVAGDDGGWTADGNSIKTKGVRPKVRFSDKREEIIRQASEEEEEEEDEEEGQGFDFQDEDEMERHSGQGEGGGALTEFTNHRTELPPSPASSHSSEYEGVTPLDRRRAEPRHSETDSEEEEEGRGYTFEDEFDDEIGL